MKFGTTSPVLNDKVFRSGMQSTDEIMTKEGTYMKTGILLTLCVCAASFTFSSGGMVWMWPGIIGGLIFALITAFKKEWSAITAPAYAIFEGLALGGISYAYQAMYQGIVVNAVMLTFAVFIIMLVLFQTRIIQVTDKLRTGITVATGAIFLVYMVSFIMSFFGASIPMIHGSGMIGIGFSLLVVGIASFNLLLNFDFIENASRTNQLPKYMEWFGAFGLMVTLVWLYLEILRLLSKLNSRR